MFFIFVWGKRYRTENWGPIAPARCPECRRTVNFQHVVTTVTRHAFFIPTSDGEPAHALMCPICRLVIHVPPTFATAVSGMSAVRVRWQAEMVSDDDYRDAIAEFWEAIQVIDGYRGPRAADAAVALGRDDETNTSAGWLPDPTGRHDRRYHDGTWWTAFVLNQGETSSDTVLTPTRPGWYPDPHVRHELRQWDGYRWTDRTQDAGAEVLDPC